MPDVKVKLLRPLNNQEVGSEVTYSKADAERLAGYGAVEILGDAPANEPEAKAEEAAPENKSEGDSPQNKAEPAAPANKAKAVKAAKGK